MCALSDITARALGPGKTLGGRYDLLAPLGRGGFGEVWKAQDTHTGDIVAVKMPQHQFAVDPNVVGSLRQECQVLKTLSHPNICRLLDLGNDPLYGPLLVTEFVDGTDLWRTSRDWSWQELVGTLIGILHGLSYLHGKKIMHLDLKPPNILVSSSGPRLIDFGLASFTSPKHHSGTMSYTAPETILHKTRTVSADVYSLGVLIYECLTRTNPFRDPNREETRRRQEEDTPAPPKTLHGDIPEWFSTLVMKMIRKKPEERCSIGEILDTIRIGHNSHDTPDAAHVRSFAAASGKFVGRLDILKQLRDAFSFASEPKIYRAAISGAPGMGKTRILKEIKFGAQIMGMQTIVLASASDASPALLAPVAEALGLPKHPVLLLLDDFDQWGERAPALKALLETLHIHPHPASWIGCVMTVSQSAKRPDFVLVPFTEDELSQYLAAIAPIPDGPRLQLAHQLLQQTRGNPGHVGDLMERMVTRRYFASDRGQWNASLFEDMTVEISEVFGPDSLAVPDNRLLEICRRERLDGHAAKAFERIARYFDAACRSGKADLRILVEAAECALACGRSSEAVRWMEVADAGNDVTVLYWKGILLSALRRFPEAKNTLEAARRMAVASVDDVLEIRIANQLARCDLLDRDYDGAVAAYRQTAVRTRKLEKDRRDQIVNNELGYALLLKGQYAEAQLLLEEQMRLCEKTGHVRRYLNAVIQIGDCHARTGKSSEATTMYLRAIARARGAQQIDILSHAYNQFGRLQFENNMTDLAPATLGRAIAINHAIGDLSAAAVNTTNMGLCQLRAGLTEDAKLNIETATSFLKRCPDAVQRSLVPCMIALAEIARQEHQRDRGLACLDEAAALANRHNVYPEYRDAIETTRKEIEDHLSRNPESCTES